MVKHNDDLSLTLKARIAPQGNEDSQKADLWTECRMCSLASVRIVLSVAPLQKEMLVKVDVKSAFLQSGNARRDVYVIPPRESTNGSLYWLLLSAAYSLVIAKAKWQEKSDGLLYELGL